MARVFVVLSCIFVLAGCATSSRTDATLDEVQRAAYVPGGQPHLTLFTVVNNNTGAGGHSALLVSGRQQVVFDPAGSFQHEQIAERGDVLYGMSPGWVAAYKSAHARSTFHVVSQRVDLTPEQADTALRLVQENGAVGSAFCANATSRILSQIPGFEDVAVTFFPVKLMTQMSARSDVEVDAYYENDAGDVADGIAAAQF